MAYFKFVDNNNQIIHITSDYYQNVTVDCEGSWFSMSDEEHKEYMDIQMEYLKNNPPPPIPEPEPLTPQQKLEQAGLTVEELKELLGL